MMVWRYYPGDGGQLELPSSLPDWENGGDI
jgi:hypothetical protein